MDRGRLRRAVRAVLPPGARRRLRSLAGALHLRLRPHLPLALRGDLPRVPQPRTAVGHVVFAALGERSFGWGKMVPHRFLPPFCAVLAEHGLRSEFAFTPRQLARWDRDNVAVICVDNEDFDLERLRAAAPRMTRAVVFNPPQLGALIADKAQTNAHLSRHGIPVPRMVTATEGQVFSNAVASSGAEVRVVEAGARLDPDRYNTEFIDTRVGHGGQEYYSCLRLMCVNARVVAIHCRLRPTGDGSPSVHTRNTPRDPALIEALHADLVERNRPRLEALAGDLFAALSPGFLAHDVLVERGTGALLVAETGVKFHNGGLEDHLSEFAADLPSYGDLFGGRGHRKAARAFVEELRRLNVLPPGRSAPY